jgi:hypothetical protein
MTTINDQIANNTDLALEIADIAEMLDREFKCASLMIVQGMDLNHVRLLLNSLTEFSTELRQGMKTMAAAAA